MNDRVFEAARGERERMKLCLWEARVYLSPKRVACGDGAPSTRARLSKFEESDQCYEYVRAQFEERRDAPAHYLDAFTWEQFCRQTGFGEARRKRQLEAVRAERNRRNAQSSTGPRSDAGKRRSSRNAVKHGLYAKKFPLTPDEVVVLEGMRVELENVHQPVGREERELVKRMAESNFRQTRLRGYESDASETSPVTNAVVRKATRAAGLELERAEAALRGLQERRLAPLRLAA